MADINPNWYNIFPHTCFSIANLDWLISKYGEQDDAIKKIEASDAAQNIAIADHETRIDALETFEADIVPRVETLENDVSGLQTAVSRIDNSLTDLENDVDDLESEVSDIETRLGQTENTVRNIDTRVDDCEEAISDLQSEDTSMSNRIQANTNDIVALDSRVDTLEGHSVIANAGGATSGVLSTLNVDGTNYEVPQGGGGGGSTVIPNASGTPTADLTSLGVDGYVYSIPTGIDTSDLIAEEYDPTDYYDTGDLVIYNGDLYRAIDDSITGAWDDNKWVETTVAEECANASGTATSVYNMYADLGTAYEDTTSYEDDTSASGTIVGPGMTRTLTPGSWVVTYNATFDTHELGSKQRTCNIYLDVNDVTIAQNSKYMWGTEAITSVLHENSTSLTAVVDVPYGTTKTIKPKTAVRVSSGTYSYDVTVRAGYVRIKPYSA